MRGWLENMSEAPKMVQVVIYVPPKYIVLLDELVGKGRYPSRSEAVRIAVRDLLRSEGAWGACVSDGIPAGMALADVEEEGESRWVREGRNK